MILINMMMAIINLAFEETRSNAESFQNRFELLDYIKRSCKEVIGVALAKKVKIVYQEDLEKDKELSSDEEDEDR